VGRAPGIQLNDDVSGEMNNNDDDDEEQDGDADGPHAPRASNVSFAAAGKGEAVPPLPARIGRVYYINAYGQEIRPAPNRDFLVNLGRYDVLVYSCGSLWTRCARRPAQ
jgi:hypothetical protein